MSRGIDVPERKNADKVRTAVAKHYRKIAKEGKSCCDTTSEDSEIVKIYTPEDLAVLPGDAKNSSCACGNPVAIAELKPGQVVLDMGSGAGLDVFLAAKKVGPDGRVIGVDALPEMLAKANKFARLMGFSNIEFRKGDIENLPVDPDSVDVIISNCVINLSPEKEKVFSEAYRVLRKGGRMLVSDVMVSQMPDEVRENISTWASCIGGAIELEEYTKKISEAGFTDIRVINNNKYSKELIKDSIAGIECSLAEDEKTILHKAEESFSISHADIQAVKT